MQSKKRGPQPKGYISFHLKLVKSDLEFLRQLSDSSHQSVNAIIRDLISDWVLWLKQINEKEKTASPGERTPEETVSIIVAEITGEVKQELKCDK